MATNDLSVSVNKFMLANAPTIPEASSMSYDLLKSLATHLLFTVKTSKEHACYVMLKRYGSIYHQDVISRIIKEAITDEQDAKVSASTRRRLARKAQMLSQPRLLIA